jgi:hypothetical protein
MEVEKETVEKIEKFLNENFKGKDYILDFTVVNNADGDSGDVNATIVSRSTIRNNTPWFIGKTLTLIHINHANASMRNLRDGITQKTEKDGDKNQYG